LEYSLTSIECIGFHKTSRDYTKVDGYDGGCKWHIYHTDEFYCKYYWRKGKCKVPNKSVYRFDATRGIKGNKEKLINLLKEDDLAYLKFKKH
jgi:hypothetical protein